MRGQLYRKETKRRDPRGKVGKPLKREIRVGSRVWTWEVLSTKGHFGCGGPAGVRIRSPDGRGTWFVNADYFITDRVWDCDSREQGWCSGYCYQCGPKYEGPGFQPSLVRKYIQQVCLAGGDPTE